MSAAVRPSAFVLRRARQVPVPQRFTRRWQTTAAKPATYDEMLELMETEYPDPNKPRSRSARTPKVPSSAQHVQQQHDQPDARSELSTASEPAFDLPNTMPGLTATGNARAQPKYKSANKKLPGSPRNIAQDEHKPRRIPPPVYKPTTDHVNDQVLEKTTIRTSQPSAEGSDQSQALETQDPLISLDSDESTKQSSVLKSLRKVSSQDDSPAQTPRKIPFKELGLNPLETIRVTGGGRLSGVGRVFDNIFLRDSCTCSQCVDTSTRQKRFDSADIPTNIRIRNMETKHDNVVITWKHDVPGFGPDHETVLNTEHLAWSPDFPKTHEYLGGKFAWDHASLENSRLDFDYNEYMSDEKVLFDLLQQLQMYGLVFIKNVPEAESSVVQTANRIGPLKNTFYGDTWDVRSVSNAKNVAYTDVNLGFHMDLLYMQQPPRLQLLHCLRASEQGGVSLFSDAYRAVQQLYNMDQAAFEALAETPVNFHYDNDNHHYFRSRRTFQLREGVTKLPRNHPKVYNYLDAVNWAPPFQAPFHHTEGDVKFAKSMRAWHEAAQTFRDLTELDYNVYRRQMAPGECVIFDNRRVLHARTAFAGGERWLRGAYLDDDPYLSKMRVLARAYGSQSFKSRTRPSPVPSK
ncbi:Clavaminate synthase-like protein, partial [Aureobasidium melanogenum]